MKKSIIFSLLCLLVQASFLFAQTKVSGIVVDKTNQPIPFANVAFKDSNVGTVANEDGRFYLESPTTYTALIVTSVGFSDREVTLEKAVNYNFRV